MNTLEITKLFGAACGSLLVFLLIQMAAGGLFYTGSGAEAYLIAVDEPAPAAEEPAGAIDVAELLAAADAATGEAIWRRCQACHVLEPGQNRVGPYLHGVVGRDIASAEGFSYSGALGGLDGDWDYEALYGFLENPSGWAPGTTMNFAGLSSFEDRANIIAYMEQHSD
ncbi:cytochrome c family protein [soil metagenome]